MKAKIISLDESVVLGFRLGGILGHTLSNNTDCSSFFNDIIRETDLALLIITNDVYKKIKDDVDEFRKKNSKPLIVIID